MSERVSMATPSPWLNPRYLAWSAGATLLVALLLGIPTDVVPNPWFTRMIAAEPFNYLFWIVTSALGGALLATRVLPQADGAGRPMGASLGTGALGLLAVGCPICNKLVVALLGSSGALTYFAPLQPVLGGVAVLLAASALGFRVRAARRACVLPATRDA